MLRYKLTVLSIRFSAGLITTIVNSAFVVKMFKPDFRKPVTYEPVMFYILPEENVEAPKANTFLNPQLSPAGHANQWRPVAAKKTMRLLLLSLNEKRRATVKIAGSGGDVWTTTRERLHSRLKTMAA